ncbi:dihydrodipicolinate reductase [Mangrovicoccus sp. HB161399]|uniref:dihydrodipicolinate reductase n=1 Tax=Mangrovicoccus sp. HB161399 TaxID=2720392 RepID=UPI001557C234|nr:dihydrodipicolinate reductase [Mangrovicoccus sp. HB161399]
MARAFAAVLLALLAASPARAEFRVVQKESEFRSLVSGRELTRLGVSLTVTQGGAIAGRAFGRDVTGQWRWQDGYFCRDLAWGARSFPHNCQQVAIDGDRLRFASDRGTGEAAVLNLR